MISSLSLVDFKCFKLLALDLSMINVLAGMNGSGKSTVIQSLLVRRILVACLVHVQQLFGTERRVSCADRNNRFRCGLVF